METLFDVTPMLDPFYAATLDFCSSLVGHPVNRLEAGVPRSSNFCAVAATLAKHLPDDAYDWPQGEPLTSEYIECRGGGAGLFTVDTERVIFPATRDLEIGLDVDPDVAVVKATYDDVCIDGVLWGWEQNDYGTLSRVAYVPTLVDTFMEQFDLGGWRSFTLDLEG